jgi:hypothetical protein
MAAESKENFESGVSTLVKELETYRLDPVSMAGLANCENRRQLACANMHV